MFECILYKNIMAAASGFLRSRIRYDCPCWLLHPAFGAEAAGDECDSHTSKTPAKLDTGRFFERKWQADLLKLGAVRLY